MPISISLITLPSLYLLAAIIAPITFRIFRTFKNKVIILAICAINLVLSLIYTFQAYFNDITPALQSIPWLYFSTELSAPFSWIAISTGFSLSGLIAILYIPRNIFHSTISLFLILLALLQFTSLSNNFDTIVILSIISCLIINIPLHQNFKENNQLSALISLLGWLRASDILLLFSVIFWHLDISANFCSALLLTGIFIRFSFLIAVSSLRVLFPFNTSTTNLFYCFCLGLGSVLLLAKSQLVIIIPTVQIYIFVILYCLSAFAAFFSTELNADTLKQNINLPFILLPILSVLTLLKLEFYMIVSFIFVANILAFTFSKVASESFTEKKPLKWKITLIFSKLHLDNLIEGLYLKIASNISQFVRKILSPTINIIWLQIPAFTTGASTLLVKIFNTGGAQKAISIIFIGLILFLIYYVGISL